MQFGVPFRRRVTFVMALCLGLVALADWLFYDHPIGWTAGLFAVALLAALSLRNGRYLRTWPGRWVALGVVGMSVALFVEPGPLPILLAAFGLIALGVIDRGGWTSRLAVLALRGMIFVSEAMVTPLRDARLQHRWQRSRGQPWSGVFAYGGWLLPVLFSLVFVVLFVLANPIIDGWVAVLPEHFTLARWLLWCAVGLSTWGLLRAPAMRLRSLPGFRRLETSGPTEYNFGSIMPLSADALGDLVLRCLVLFNLVFAVQNVLDLRYLWGESVLPDGMTFAEYSHRGAYPLVVTALLAGVFVLMSFSGRVMNEAGTTTWRAARWLCCVWIGQNILLMSGAAYRLSLYVEAYSLTRWRIAAIIWMGLVAIGLALLTWRIIRNLDNRWLVQRVTLAAVVVLYACSFVNFDGMIARYNVRHCAEVGVADSMPLDMDYLERLGAESLPALAWLREHEATTEEVRQRVRETEARLLHELNVQLADWRGHTVLRRRIHEAHDRRTHPAPAEEISRTSNTSSGPVL